ncbi:hypothetical protein Pfo_016848 [Paulownia fortunei]|nr:hypothetical protein Pfo_016848 [Paulownia fortunei]
MTDELWLYLVLFCPILYFLLKFIVSKLVKIPENLPPGPPALPILGHLHLLKEPVHRTLHQLSQKYGVMFLKFRVRKLLVVSSSQAAEECFTKNDIIFANRPELLAGKLLNYNCTTMGFAPYGDHWRNSRRLTALEIFSPSRLAMFSSIHQEEVRLMLQQLYGISSRPNQGKVELRSILSDLSFNIMMIMIAGKRYYGKDANVMGEEARLFQSIMKEVVELHGNSNLGDYFPLFQWVDIQGVQKRMVNFMKKLDNFLQNLVDEHKKFRTESIQISDASTGRKEIKRKTLIDVMLSLQETETEPEPELHSDEIIKGLILAMLGAGTETSSTTLEWAMSLLLNHPEAMKKASNEIETCCGQDRLLDEQGLPKLTFLHNVVNETLETIPRGIMLLVNLWTIHRDPKLWEDSTAFKPERFSGGEAEGYKLIPFGAGRRACPGASLGRRMVMLTLGAMIQCFEWGRVGQEEIDMAEATGLIMPKLTSLEAVCKPRENIINLLS